VRVDANQAQPDMRGEMLRPVPRSGERSAVIREPNRPALPLELARRLRARRGEIEEAVLARAGVVDDPARVFDPEYALGLRRTVRAVVELAIAVLEDGLEPAVVIPVEPIAQAHRAARNGVPLGTVLRRYAGGYVLLCDYLLREAGDAPAHEVRQALRAVGMVLERINNAVVDAYGQELDRRDGSTERRRIEQVKRLLDGESGDTAELLYDLDLWHLAVVATGPKAADVVRELFAAANRRLLMVRPERGEVWAWAGGQDRLAAEELAQLARRARHRLTGDVTVAIGEPGRGISGWRLTHRQAKLALSVALRSGDFLVTYPDVALLASVLMDNVLQESLRQAYLAPLEDERDGGVALRETLRAYLEAGKNVSSAAAALGVSRQTVKRRVSLAEERIGHPVSERAVEIETALRLPLSG